MKVHSEITIRRFNPRFPQDGGLDEHEFEGLAALFPNHVNKRRTRIKIEGDECEDLVIGARACLKERMIDVPERYEKGKSVTVRKYKEFTDDEIREAPFLEPFSFGPDLVECDRLNSQITPWMVRKVKNRSDELGHIWAYPNQLAATNKCVDRLLECGLRHFLPVELDRTPNITDQFFLLWSDVEMPPVENQLFDNSGRVFESDDAPDMSSAGCLLLDGHFVTPQMRYCKRQIEQMDEFDIAFSKESFGNSEPRVRSTIVSQRFRRRFEDFGVKISWIPVLLT